MTPIILFHGGTISCPHAFIGKSALPIFLPFFDHTVTVFIKIVRVNTTCYQKRRRLSHLKSSSIHFFKKVKYNSVHNSTISGVPYTVLPTAKFYCPTIA